MRPLAVKIPQPALCNLPRFIQGSEQINIKDFRLVEPFHNGTLRRFARLKKFGLHAMFFGPL